MLRSLLDSIAGRELAFASALPQSSAAGKSQAFAAKAHFAQGGSSSSTATAFVAAPSLNAGPRGAPGSFQEFLFPSREDLAIPKQGRTTRTAFAADAPDDAGKSAKEKEADSNDGDEDKIFLWGNTEGMPKVTIDGSAARFFETPDITDPN